jgi:hypothetical protein
VIVTDTLPLSITFLNHSAAITPAIDGSQVTWELGHLDPQEEIGFALAGQVTETVTPGEIVQNKIKLSP